MKPILLIPLAFLLVLGCAGPDGHVRKLHALPFRAGNCGVHQVPLQTVICYEPGGPMHPNWSAQVAHEKYPNALPLCYSATRSAFYYEPRQTRYCPQCERGVTDYLARNPGWPAAEDVSPYRSAGEKH